MTPIQIARLITEDPDVQQDLSVLYHGTSTQHLETIMRDGLDPALSQYADDEEANDYGEVSPGVYGQVLGPPYHFIFLSTSPRCAESFASGGENNNMDKSEMALLEINLPPELQEQLILDRGEFIRCPFVIDPKYIKVIRPRGYSVQ